MADWLGILNKGPLLVSPQSVLSGQVWVALPRAWRRLSTSSSHSAGNARTSAYAGTGHSHAIKQLDECKTNCCSSIAQNGILRSVLHQATQVLGSWDVYDDAARRSAMHRPNAGKPVCRTVAIGAGFPVNPTADSNGCEKSRRTAAMGHDR